MALGSIEPRLRMYKTPQVELRPSNRRESSELRKQSTIKTITILNSPTERVNSE
jgi:hypothetical protein